MSRRSLGLSGGLGRTGLRPGDISGNAATAAALRTARNINGVSFDGTADVSVSGEHAIAAAWGALPGCTINTTTTYIGLQSTIWYMPFFVRYPITVSALCCQVTSPGPAGSKARFGLYALDPTTLQPGALKADLGEVACDSAAAKTISGLSVDLDPGLYAIFMANDDNASQPTFACVVGGLASGTILGPSNMTPLKFIRKGSVSYAVCPSTGTAWISSGTNQTGFFYQAMLQFTNR